MACSTAFTKSRNRFLDKAPCSLAKRCCPKGSEPLPAYLVQTGVLQVSASSRPSSGGANDMTYDRFRWLRERIREPGDVIVLPVVYPDDPRRRMKLRPCVLLSRVDFDTQDNATVTPFSTSSCEENSIQVEATSTNGLALNSSFTPSVLLEIDPLEILKKTVQGNVGESTLTIIRTAVEMENQE